MALEVGRLSQADLVVVGCYLVIILLVGLAAMLRKKRGGAEGYFLAGSTVPWYQVGASVFASNIGSQHFIGLAGTGAASGYAIIWFEWMAGLHLLGLAYLFLPVYLSSAVFTMPEYVGRRFQSNRIRMFLSGLSLFMIMFIQIPGDMFAGSVFLQTILKWNLYNAIFLLMGITGIYTIAGGLAAVVYTETFQTLLIVVGGVVLAILGFNEIGGYHNLGEKFLHAYTNESLTTNNTCGIPQVDSLHLYRGIHDDLPTLGFFTGFAMNGLWYWAANQVIVQRSLACKNLAHGQGGLIMAAALKMSPMFLMVMPGMISRILFPDQVGCSDPVKCTEICQNPNGCTNIAYPLLVINLLPSGLRGFLTAVMLSAIMSSLASAFNSAGTMFTLDIWTKLRKIPMDWRMNKLTPQQRRKNEFEIMLIGRLIMIVFMVVGGLWTPVVQRFGNNGQLFVYIASIWGATTSPLIAVFLLALFWHKVSEPGIFWCLVVGFCSSLLRIILEVTHPNPRCGETDTRSPFFQAVMIHYFYFSALNFCIALAVAISISFFTNPIPESSLYRLTFWTRQSKQPRKKTQVSESNDNDVVSPEAMECASEKTQETTFVQNQTTSSSEDVFLSDDGDDHFDEIKDTEQLIPGAKLNNSSRHQVKIQKGSNESSNSRNTGKHEKLKKFFYWFFGVSTFAGKPVDMETQEEREQKMQKRLKLSSGLRAFIVFNWAFVIGVYIILYVVYW